MVCYTINIMNDIEKMKESGKMKERIILALMKDNVKDFLKALSNEELLLVKKILSMNEEQ